jgi:hypothetical protein
MRYENVSEKEPISTDEEKIENLISKQQKTRSFLNSNPKCYLNKKNSG